MENTIPLGKIADVYYGKKSMTIPYNGIRMLRITDVKSYSLLGDEKVSSSTTENKLFPDDILLARTGSFFEPFLFRGYEEPCTYSSFFYRIHSKGDILTDSIYYQLQSSRFKKYIYSKLKGRNITKNDVVEYPFLLDISQDLCTLHFSESIIRKQCEVIRITQNLQNAILKETYLSNPNVRLGELVKPVHAINAIDGLKGGTIVYSASGPAGYTDKRGLGVDSIAIQKNGGTAEIHVIPAGTVADKSLLWLQTNEIPAAEMKIILAALNLKNYLVGSSVPHLKFDNIRDIPVHYVRNMDTTGAKMAQKQVDTECQLLEAYIKQHKAILNYAYGGNKA